MFFFPISVLKSNGFCQRFAEYLQIFRPKCGHAAELRTLRILNCSLSSVIRKARKPFLCHQACEPSQKKIYIYIYIPTYLPYLMFFQPLPEPHNYFYLALALKLPENRVVFKPEAVEKKWKKRRCGIIPDTNYTKVDCV